MQAMQNVFRNSSCVVSGGQPLRHDPAGADREIRLVGDFQDRDWFAARQVANVAVADKRLEERIGERPRHLGHLVAAVRPVHVRRISSVVLGARDRDDRFGRGRAAADHQDRFTDVLRRHGETEGQAFDACRGCRTGAARRDRRPARRGGSGTVCSDLRLWFQVMTFHKLAFTLEAGHLDADLCRDSMLPVERLPGHAHVVFVDGREVQLGDAARRLSGTACDRRRRSPAGSACPSDSRGCASSGRRSRRPAHCGRAP